MITSADIAAMNKPTGASKPPRRNEGALVKAVLHYLAVRGVFAWRCNSGGVRAAYKGKERFFRFNSRPGMSDIIGVISPEGRVLAVECKVKPNIATPDQLDFLAGIRAYGGIGIVAYSVEDVEDALGPKQEQP